MTELSLPDKIAALNGALTRARIPHAFGGALALAYYAEPRATIDIDLNLFIGTEEHSEVAAVLSELGVDIETDRAALERDGQCRLWWGRTPVDLFYSYNELHEAMRLAARTVPFADGRIPILAPEHLIVCKAAFDRPKDWIDIEQMIAFVDALDLGEVREQVAATLGPDSDSLERIEDLARDLS
jgi:hypothetical protein